MRKWLLTLFVGMAVLPLMAQTGGSTTGAAGSGGDITKNPYYVKSLEYRDLARQALEAGDYKKSIEYSNLGIRELDKYRGNNGILLAEQQLRAARERGLDKRFADQYNQAVELVESAKKKLVEGDYEGSVQDSDKALAILRNMFASTGVNLVNEYKVVWGDCLWRIAKKPEIYNDAFAWPRIYMANKDRMRYPDNPNLIYPDQVFRIPR
jgi:nucleoid-associated protein YgaU